MSNPTTDRSRQPGGQPNGGEFATEAKGTDTGVDLARDHEERERMEDIRRYNSSGSYFYPRAPKSVDQVIDFWDNVAIPDAVLTTLVNRYRKRMRSELDPISTRIYNEEIKPEWDERVKKMSRKERNELDKRMKTAREGGDPETGLSYEGTADVEATKRAVKEYDREFGYPRVIINHDVQTVVRAYGVGRSAMVFPKGSPEQNALFDHEYPIRGLNENMTVEDVIQRYRLADFHDVLTNDTSLNEREEEERQHRETIETMRANSDTQARLIAELIDSLERQGR